MKCTFYSVTVYYAMWRNKNKLKLAIGGVLVIFSGESLKVEIETIIKSLLNKPIDCLHHSTSPHQAKFVELRSQAQITSTQSLPARSIVLALAGRNT
jgi:hypothetical protein